MAQDHEFLNLTRYASTLGDPAKFFVNREGPVPIVTEHATGESKYVIDAEGVLRAIDDYKAAKIPAHELPLAIPQPNEFQFGKREPAPEGMSLQSQSPFAGVRLEVTPK